jgi:hypothetical protein
MARATAALWNNGWRMVIFLQLGITESEEAAGGLAARRTGMALPDKKPGSTACRIKTPVRWPNPAQNAMVGRDDQGRAARAA